MPEKKFLQIAIDGPVAAGKGSVAFLLAKRLGLLYVDTGAIYRAAAVYIIRCGIEIDRENEDKIVSLLKKVDIKIIASDFEDQRSRIKINSYDLTSDIRTPLADIASSQIALLSTVRQVITEKVGKNVEKKGVVMEGRDIGTVVLPEAAVKIFLTATLEERARRRFKEYKRKGRRVAYEVVLKQLAERDRKDAEREVAPLVKADNALEIDTTNLSIKEVVSKIETVLKARNLV